MNRIKAYLDSFGKISRTIILSLAVIFVGAGLAQAAVTTIGTTIVTTGTFSSGNATTSALSASGEFSVGGNATTTALGAFATQGAVTLASTLSVTGLATFLGGASTTQLRLLSGDTIKNATASSTTLSGDLTVSTITATGLTATGNTTLASTTATSFKVGQTGSQLTRATAGICSTVASALTASTTTMLTCTPSGGTGILLAADRVFVMATSSLPGRAYISSASSTAAGTIQVNVYNTGIDAGTIGSSAYGFNFWAFQP